MSVGYYTQVKQSGRLGSAKNLTWNKELKTHICCGSHLDWYHRADCPAARRCIKCTIKLNHPWSGGSPDGIHCNDCYEKRIAGFGGFGKPKFKPFICSYGYGGCGEKYYINDDGYEIGHSPFCRKTQHNPKNP